MDAICFCLGENNERLRVTNSKELLSNLNGIVSQAEQTEASVQIVLRETANSFSGINAPKSVLLKAVISSKVNRSLRNYMFD